ncbi:hypothetical protein [Micromonospora sp. DT229]|uniref:hypothetical protein n=1 Tax=Micromonospora sp. DT229 TaxID=3393430 RepID=UPI003CED61B1
MNSLVAQRIGEGRLAELQLMSFGELEPLLEESRRTAEVVDGVTYNVVAYALPDIGESIRVVVAVDDGGSSALKPSVVDFIVEP